MTFELGTKADTLQNLLGRLKNATVLPLVHFTVSQWAKEPSKIIARIKDKFPGNHSLIARSSALNEDSRETSAAGKYKTVLNITNSYELERAINDVISSYEVYNSNDQVFVQKMLFDVDFSGVAFTKDPNTGGHYYVINYDDSTGMLNTITSGSNNDTHVYYLEKYNFDMANIPTILFPLIKLLQELQETVGSEDLDIEFAVKSGILYLLQVRYLLLNNISSLSRERHSELLSQAANKIELLSKPHPYLHGSRAVFGVMPDWNPAEIIGIRPRPLAMSLYKELITDGIWSYQRDNYGYRNLRSFPLMISLAGLPYIDVRVSFNSFVPADIEEGLASKLVNFYIDSLTKTPCYHDKIEFEIIFSCYTLDLENRLNRLLESGFTKEEANVLSDSLRVLTNRIIQEENGLWIEDTNKIFELENRQQMIKNSNLDPISKIYWLIEDCKRYGTLPFAGLARAGFIAIQMLQSLVAKEILTPSQYASYMSSLTTVSSNMLRDFKHLNKAEFLAKYGHLRPGTYDILSKRYDEAPDDYFDFEYNNLSDENFHENFTLSLEQLRSLDELLKSHQLNVNVLGLFTFIKGAIEGREYAKFIFTKSLSDILNYLQDYGSTYGLTKEDLSYLDIAAIQDLYSCSKDPISVIEKSILFGKSAFDASNRIVMPSLITDPSNIFGFYQPLGLPNFITLKNFTGEVVLLTDENDKVLEGKILMIPNADPGYDWIFSRNIACFITIYGGLNSHMSIRAAELGIPAVIGAGELLYNRWMKAKQLKVDCGNKKVTILQ